MKNARPQAVKFVSEASQPNGVSINAENLNGDDSMTTNAMHRASDFLIQDQETQPVAYEEILSSRRSQPLHPGKSILKPPSSSKQLKAHQSYLSYPLGWLKTRHWFSSIPQEMAHDSTTAATSNDTNIHNNHDSNGAHSSRIGVSKDNLANNGSMHTRALDPADIRRVRFSLPALLTEYEPSNTSSTSPRLDGGDRDENDGSKFKKDMSSHPTWDVKAITTRMYTLEQVLDIYYRTCWNMDQYPLESIEQAFRTRISLGKPMPTLALSGTLFKHKDIIAFGEILDLQFGLKRLELSYCNLDDKAIHILTYSLLCSDSIQYLDISNNGRISYRGIKSLATYIYKSKVLRTINMSGIPLSDKGAAFLTSALSSPDSALRILFMDNCKLKPSVFSKLVPGVQKSSLRFLSLRLNKVSEHHSHVLKSLLEGDSGCKLEALDLSQNLLRLAMPSICLALSSNTHLKELSLTKNNLSSDSLVNIAKCLPKNRSLTSLDLSNNPLTYYGMDGLNELKIELPSNKFLQCLFMSDTKLTTEGAIILAEGLPDLRHLQRLDISLNPGIDTAGILALSASMKSNRSLLCLEVTIDSSDELANLFEQEIVKACIENMERPNHPPNYDSDSDSKSNDSLTSGNNRIKTNTTTIREKNCTNPRKLIPTPSFVSIHHSSSCSTHSSSSLGPMIKKKESHSSFDSIVKARNSLEVHGTNSDIKHRHSHDGIAIPSIQVRGSEITCARRSSFEGTASPVLLASSSPRSQHMIVFHDDIGYTSQTPEYHENLFELRKKADKDEGQTLRQISAEPNVSIKPISNDSQAGIGQAVTTSRLKIEGRRHEPNELDLQSAPAKPGFSDDNSNRSKSPNIQHTDQV